MITRLLYDQEKDHYNALAKHPVQTWEWGDFQITQGHTVYRLGVFDNTAMLSAYSLSFHRLPKLNYTVGTILRGPAVNADLLSNINKIALENQAIFIKLEPDVEKLASPGLNFPSLVISPKVAFYPFTYVIDLTKSEDELLSSMHSKTRYNIKIANRHGVKIEEASTDAGFEIYLKLLFETTRRQGFYLHSQKYHRDLWRILKPTGFPRIFLANYNGLTLAAFMVFVFQDKLYYPYGASTDTYRQVMAPNLLMWEIIRFGKSLGLKTFDLWGCLGPAVKESDPAFGFHRFKHGYGGRLVEFVGTYDYVVNPNLYPLYNLIDKYRWQFLRLKARVLR